MLKTRQALLATQAVSCPEGMPMAKENPHPL